MKKTRIRFMAFVLTIILMSTAMPVNVLASKSEVIAEGNMRTIIESDFSDIHNMEYTYEENGEIFKAVENINEDFDKVESKIFKKVNDEFILFKELETVIKENKDNIEVLTMNLTTGEQKTNISKKPTEEFEVIDKSLTDPLYYSSSSSSPYPRYETYKIKNGNLVTDALEVAAISTALMTIFGVNKVTVESVKKTIATFCANTAATIYMKGHKITYYTDRSYISIYLEARETDPMYKYWDSVYRDSARKKLIDEQEYDSGVNW
ncbi:hypothetical protein [Tissierella praeacuta]|uniref:hypothetical protein n=1 Tax=Tissierella praeacuta TaxID=43131 RepID=UPI0028AD20FB|nr:hypothetical protein [Tissierella praeacuta]